MESCFEYKIRIIDAKFSICYYVNMHTYMLTLMETYEKVHDKEYMLAGYNQRKLN